MQLSPSAHTDTFCRDNLPPADQWPELRFDLPELRYPERLNCAEALLDATVARLGPDRPCLRTPTDPWTYGDLLQRANQAATSQGLFGPRSSTRLPGTRPKSEVKTCAAWFARWSRSP